MKSKGKRTKEIIMWLVAGVTFLAVILMNMRPRWVEELARPAYAEADASKELMMMDEDGNRTPIVVPVKARVLAGEALWLAFDQTYDVICEEMKGDNPSLHQVTSDLKLPTRPGEYGMRADYSWNDYSLISPNGAVNTESLKNPVECEIRVTLAYGKIEQEYFISVTLLPMTTTPEEAMVQDVLQNIRNQGENGGDSIVLPSQLGGKKLRYYEQDDGIVTAAFGLLTLVAAYWYYRRYVIPRKNREAREASLHKDYAELVSTISLLVGAGMSVSNATKKIYDDYEKRVHKKGTRKNKLQPAYEELGVAIRKMDAGMPEIKAYQEYGRACALHCYIRFAGLLAQNIKKGNAELLEQLSSEAIVAFEERKAMAIRAGEKAGTKLVFPMLLMLAIVFVIIIVPAFASMYS